MDDQEFARVTSGWQFQRYKDSCWPTCVKNILDDMSRRLNDPTLRFSMSDVNSICGFKEELGCQPGNVTPMLNKTFRDRNMIYEAREVTRRSNDIEMLKRILSNQNCSYPLINVHSDYHIEQAIAIDGRLYDHTLVVVAVDDQNTWFHDPYKPFAERTGRIAKFNNNIPNVRMLDYWDRAWETRWAMWVEKKIGTLESYGVVSHA